MAARNRSVAEMPCFLGAGAYRHFIPSVVDYVIRQGAFATAYTPYQPEISQGTLQSIFEFQSLVCELTGMDVANAGMYDGASALAEACLMAVRITGRDRLALLSTVNPTYQRVVQTYAEGHALPVDVMEPDASTLTDKHACLVVQQPNFFGYFEDADRAGEARPRRRRSLRRRPGGDVARHVQAAGRVRRGHRRRRRAAAGHSPELRRAVRRPVRDATAARPPDAGPPRRPDEGRRRADRLRADAPDARAAHPARARDLQHLHERAALRPGRDRLPLRDGQAGPAQGRRALLPQGALRRREDRRAARLLAAARRARSSRSSSCAARGRRAR